MPYKFFEDIAIADVAFEAKGKNLNELFESTGLAVTNVMVKDLRSVEHKVKKKIKLEETDLEKLLFNFLQEIIYYKDAERLLLSKFDVDINEEDGKFKLEIEAFGEKLDMKKHELIVDVKAVTYHKFAVKKLKSGWSAFVILDI